MDKKIGEHLGPQPNQFEENHSFDCNVTVNEAEANKPRLMNIGVLNPPITILNRGTAAAPSCSRTTPAIPVGGRGNVFPVVHYQTLHKIATPYRIVSQTPLPPRTNATTQAFPITNQLLNIQPGSYATVSYPQQNYYANPPPTTRDSHASGSYVTPIAPRTSWQPVPNVLKCYYTVPKGFDEGASTSRNPPEMIHIENMPKSSGRAQKQRSIQISKKNLVALEAAAAAGSSTKKATQASSVANFLEQDTMRKGVEVLDSLDDHTLKLLVTKVMDLTNKMYGDYLAEELEKYLGIEKYQEIANKALNAYDEFLAKKSCDKENYRPAASTAISGVYSEPELNANDVKGKNQTAFIKMDTETSLTTSNITVNTGEVGMGQKGKGKKIKLKRINKAQRRISYDIEDSLEIVSGFDSPKMSTLTIHSSKDEDESFEMNGFAWTDNTKTVAVKVTAQEEISAADAFISEKIAELKQGDTLTDNLEEDFTFDDSKPKSLPEKIFESPDDPAAHASRTSLRDKCQPRKLLQVDGVDKNCSMEIDPFLGKDVTVKDEVEDTPTVDPNTAYFNVNSRQVGDSVLKPKMLQQKGCKPSVKSENTTTYLDVDVPSVQAQIDGSQDSRSKPKMSEKRPKQARKQPIKDEDTFFRIVPLPRPFSNIRRQVCVANGGKVEPNMTPVRCKQRLKSETTLDPLLSTPRDHVSDHKRPEISFGISSPALESTSSESAMILEEALTQTSETFDVQMCVEVESNETEANWTVETTPKIEFVNGGSRGPDFVQNPANLQSKSCKMEDQELTKDSLVNMSLSPCLPNEQGKSMLSKMWQESQLVYTSNRPQTTDSKKVKKVVIIQSCEKVDQHSTKNSVTNKTVSPCLSNGQGKSMPRLWQESEYVGKTSSPQTTKVEKVIIPQHATTVDHSLISGKNDGSKCSSLEEPKEPTTIKERLPAKNEHNITKVQQRQKHVTFLEISDEEPRESAKKEITPKNTHDIESSCLLSKLSQTNTKCSISDKFPESDHLIHVAVSTTEIAAQLPPTLKDQKYNIQDVSQNKTSKILSPVSDSNQHNKELEKNSQDNPVDKGSLSENFINIKCEREDPAENCNAQLQHVHLTENSSFPSTNTIEEQVTQKSLGQTPQKLEKDNDDTSELMTPKLENDGIENSEVTTVQLESDRNESPEQRPQKLENDGNDSPEQKSLKLDGNVSSDIETSMNDLAQLLISLQETTPIAKGTSEASSISNESFEKFAQNTVKTLDLESDDYILIEDEDPSQIAGEVTKVLQQSPEFCQVFVQQTPEFCEVNENPGTSKMTEKKTVTKTASVKCHEDKSVRDLAQLLMDFQKSGPNMIDVTLLKTRKVNKKVETTVGSGDCMMVEDTTPLQDPLEIVNRNAESLLNTTDDCVLVEVESFPHGVRYRNSDSKVSASTLARVIPTPIGLKRAKESCDTFDAYRTLPPKKNQAYEQGFIKRNPLSWTRDRVHQRPSTSLTILDYARASSDNNLPYDHYRSANDPEKRPRFVPKKSTESVSHNIDKNVPIPGALVASARADISLVGSGTTDGMALSRIIDVKLSGGRSGVDAFRRLDFKSASSGSVDVVNQRHFITPEVTISRRTKVQEQSTEFSRQPNVKPVTIIDLSRGDTRKKNRQNTFGHVKDCTFMDLSGSIVETPSTRDREVFDRRNRRMRGLRKHKEHRQRNVLRSKVRTLSQLIGRRIKAARRTFNQLSMIVNLINLNRNDVSLDNYTLKSKVRNLKTIYHTVNKTFVAFNRNDTRELKTAFREVRTARDGQARIVQAALRKRRDVPKEGGSVPSTSRSATTDVPKGEDTKYMFPVSQFEEKMILKPIKTYSKYGKSIIKDRLDSNVDIPFKGSVLDDVRQSSLNRDENIQIFINDIANPESIVPRNVCNETIPDPLEILQNGGAMSGMEMVVVKQEPLDVPEWEEVKSEAYHSEPRGIKRKAPMDRQNPIKKDEPTAVSKTWNLRKSTVSEPTPPSKKKKAIKTPEIRRSYALRSRRTGNRTIS